MDFAQKAELVRSKLKDTAVAEALGEKGIADINAALVDMSSGAQELQTLLTSANEESKERRIKNRTLTSETEALQEKYDALASDTGKEALETEVKGLREFKVGIQKAQREAFGTNFAKVVEHPAFEKASTLFTLPKKADDGKFVVDDKGVYDFSDLSDDQMTANAAKLTELSGVGLFDVADDKGNENRGDGRQRSRSNGKAGIDAIRGTKTMADLERLALEQQENASS